MTKLICLSTTIIIVFCATIAFAANPAKDLIFHFPFDEGNGKTTKDVSPNKFKGEIKNADWVEGVVGKSLQFEQGNVSVNALGVNQPEEMTIELWIKPTERLAGGARIDMLYRLAGGGRPHLTFNHGGLFFGAYLATQAAEFTVPSSYTAFEAQWYYIVITQDQDKAVLYIDGEMDGETATGGPARMDFANVGVSIGANVGSNRFFNGAMDEVKMWSVALTAEEIKKNMNQTLAVKAQDKLTTTWGKIKSGK